MNLQERIEALETEFNEKINALKAEEQQGDEFPQEGDEYWLINGDCSFQVIKWNHDSFDKRAYEIGNTYRTKEQAEFAVEKLRVDAELRKFSRPFKDNDNNYFMKIDSIYNTIVIYDEECYQTQGVIYFESEKKADGAIKSVGEERIKKYIFGVEG